MLAIMIDGQRQGNGLGPRCTDSARPVALAHSGMLICMIAGLLCCDIHLAQAFEARGMINDPQGEPIADVMVTVAGLTVTGAKTVTVFTDHTGTYQTPELGQQASADAIELSSRKIGFQQTELKKQVSSDGVLSADFVMTPREARSYTAAHLTRSEVRFSRVWCEVVLLSSRSVCRGKTRANVSRRGRCGRFFFRSPALRKRKQMAHH